MRKILAVCFASLLLATLSQAQTNATSPSTSQGQQSPASQATPSQSQPVQQTTTRIAPGSVIPVQLMKTVDSKKAKPGEEIEAKVTQDMKNGNGEILVPKDTKVVGHITEAQKRTKEQKESELGITFEHATIGGSDVAMPMSIQAIIVPPSSNAGQNSSSENSGPMSAPSGGQAPQGAPGGRSGGMGPGAQQQAPPASIPGSDLPSNEQTNGQTNNQANARQPITGNTQGVIGDPHLKLSSATTGSQPSVVSSEKDNVKLESGTMMLLRVTQ